MENAVDAIYMASAVLVLMIALAVALSSFTNVKAQVDDIVKKDEKVDLATEVDASGNKSYINYIKASGENGRIVGIETVMSSIRRVVREDYVVYIKGSSVAGILGGFEEVDGFTKISTENDNYKLLNEDKMEDLYDAMKDATFEEYIGIYQENLEGVSSANRQTHRVITYIQSP